MVAKTNLHPGDRSIYEAEVITEALDRFLMIDQLNLPNLSGAELLIRRYQLIKEAHRISPQNPDYSASDVFLGWGNERDGIDKALSRHAATELKAMAEIQKESRKAREEAALAASSTSKRGRGGKGAKGQDPAEEK